MSDNTWDVVFKRDPVVIVEQETGVQMQVTIRLGASPQWSAYLDNEEEENGMDEEKRNWMEARYDGYQMLWAFDNTELVEDADGAVDAGCISSKYGGGGFCAGIEYTGTNTKTPRAWA